MRPCIPTHHRVHRYFNSLPGLPPAHRAPTHHLPPMPPSRNDPCPCGSGKKYKSCHYARDRAAAAEAEVAAAAAAAPEAARVAALEAHVEAVTERLLRFARARYGAEWLMDVLRREGLLQNGPLPNAEVPLVLSWLTQYRVDSTGLTLVETWRRHQRDAASDDDQVILDAYANAWLSVWEVAEVQPGTGLRMVDLLTSEERFVRDVRTSDLLERRNAVLAIVLDCDGVSFYGGMYLQPLPSFEVARVTDAARRLCGVPTGVVSSQMLRDPKLHLDLLALWRKQVEEFRNLPNSMFKGPDGKPLTLTRDEYDLAAPSDVVADRLVLLPSVREVDGEPGSREFVVRQDADAMPESLKELSDVQLTLSATQLTVETASARHSDEMRAMLEANLSGLVRFRLRKEEDIAQVLRAALEQAARSGRAPDFG